jgi:endonuclease YncB( thermonuclease family)
MALRALLAGRPITCSFKQISVPPKAVCSMDGQDIAQLLLREGWGGAKPMSKHPNSPAAEAWESGVTGHL